LTNFDFLKNDAKFSQFADTAIAAELIYRIDIAASVVNCRRAMEFAVKWMYSVDADLQKPYQEELITLINTDDFRDIVGNDIINRLHYLRKLGNIVTHSPKKITKEQAKLALKNLYIFLDFIVYCYGDNYAQAGFNESLLETQTDRAELQKPINFDESLEKLRAENEALKDKLTELRNLKAKTYVRSPLDMTEDETRKAYIDIMLNAAGWEKGKNWLEEFPIELMPNKTGTGFADYVLTGDDGRPLAVIEAKRTSVEPEKGRQQAKLYADDLERRFSRRPVIFLTNGIETYIWIDGEGGYPERQVSGIFSKRFLPTE